MKINYISNLFILFFLLQWYYGQSQDVSKASSMQQYSTYPVDFYTGIPDISIPVYNMPTRSKDININVGLSYHISSVAAHNEKMGNCGRGWTLMTGGDITRTVRGYEPSEVYWKEQTNKTYALSDLWDFSFMGFSGKLFINLETNGSLKAGFIENKTDESFQVDVVSITQANGYLTIKEFVFYDSKGYKYVFQKYTDDTYNYPVGDDGVQKQIFYPSGFKLQEIYDANNNILVNYTYETFEYKRFEIKSISVPGFGSIIMNDVRGTKDFDEILIKDSFSKVIKRFDFKYTSLQSNQLIQVDTSDDAKTEVESYKLDYYISLSGNLTTDPWGYYNGVSSGCRNLGIANEMSMNGILQRMTLPTGGCVYYEFEPNTFSFTGDRAINYRTLPTGELVEIPNFFYSLNESYTGDIIASIVEGGGANNLHNYFTPAGATLAINLINDNLYTNTVNNTKTIQLAPAESYFCKLIGNQYLSEVVEGGTTYLYPSFTVNGLSVPAGSGDEGLYGACLYLNRGISATANTTIKINSGKLGVTGSATITGYSKVSPSEYKKYWRGGGIRIKSISYYANCPADGLSIPDRKITYNYNLFNESNRSSGSLINASAPRPEPSLFRGFERYPIAYKNVTIYDSMNEGKIEYTYCSPIDYEQYGTLAQTNDPRVGKLKKQKVYDKNGNAVQETDYAYSFEEAGTPNPGNTIIEAFGWIGINQIKIKNYFGTEYIETVNNFTYNLSKQVDTKTQNSSNRDVLKTIYNYNTNNSSYSKNRKELEATENYRNGELISQSKTNYSNSWADPLTGATNLSYLPSMIEAGKGSNTPETKVKFNKYDKYGHVLESEQENGLKTIYVWGYIDNQIIAKIENIGYDNLSSSVRALITAAKLASDTQGEHTIVESNLLLKLSELRNAPEFSQTFITTYTHRPLIGVSTITDPRGRTIKYEYDVSNRLKSVKDNEGKILSETEYHLKPQN